MFFNLSILKKKSLNIFVKTVIMEHFQKHTLILIKKQKNTSC